MKRLILVIGLIGVLFAAGCTASAGIRTQNTGAPCSPAVQVAEASQAR